MPICFRILGQAVSKANSREIVDMKIRGTGRTRPALIKSKEALAFEKDARAQIPSWARQMLEGEVRVTLKMFYASQQPDLDESIVLDVMQARFKKVEIGGVVQKVLLDRGVYVNDRQVREKHIYHFIDKMNPRVEIEVEPRHAQQQDLIGGGGSFQPDRLGEIPSGTAF